MKKKLVSLMVCILMLGVSFLTFAETRVAVVDLQSVLNNSKKGKEAIKMLENEFEEKKKELDKKEQELKALQDEITKRAAFWSDKIKAEKEEEFNKKLKDWRRMQVDLKDEFERKNKNYTDKILMDIIELVKEVGKNDGYDVIIEKQNAIYVADVADLTPRIIQLYDSLNAQGSK
ncbi:MAG: OmpH family outer membrane protein [Candidatus Schekmanbacteria bacterium]|nr:MAG: OmpH family outer membrane protein [Candidatus Schekmanbacteria bacterium]